MVYGGMCTGLKDEVTTLSNQVIASWRLKSHRKTTITPVCTLVNNSLLER